MKKTDWWKNFFGEDYIDFWSAKGVFDHTKREVNFFQKMIPLRKSDQILDLCCGHGRHSIELARRGYMVTGLDYSSYELDIAKKLAAKKNLDINFIHGDARRFNLKKRFDVILNLFTSFGYGTEADDRKIIQNSVRHLKPGGKFYIDVMSVTRLWSIYQPNRREKLFNGKVAVIESYFDFKNSINHEKRTIIIGRKKKVYNLSLRVYCLHDLSKLLESEGLHVVHSWGTKGEPFGLKSKRMIVLAKKI